MNENYKNRYKEVFSRFPIFTPKKPISDYQYIHFVSSIGIKISPNTTIGGFPHSYLYFDHHREEICKLFKPSEKMSNYLNKKYANILNNQDKHVGLHLRTFARGGDSGLMYLPKKDVTYLRCSFDYYDKAINHFPKDSVFVVFSDNIDCAKVLLKKYKRRRL